MSEHIKALLNIITETSRSNADGLRFELGKKPSTFQQGQNKIERENPLTLTEWNLLVDKLLDVKARQVLQEKGRISGHTLLDSVRAFYHFVEVENLKQIVLFFFKGTLTQLIPAGLDLKHLVSGIYVVSNSSALHMYYLALQIQDILQGLGKSCRVFADKNYATEWCSLTTPRDSMNFLIEGTDICFFLGKMDEKVLQVALEASEMGKVVFILTPVDGVLSLPMIVFEKIKKEAPLYGKNRFVSRVKSFTSQRVIYTQQNELHILNEVLPVSSQVAALLIQEDWGALNQLLENSPENSGILGFDQGILQLLVRRKIDIKKAFELTRNPEKFDQRLKKVGL